MPRVTDENLSRMSLLQNSAAISSAKQCFNSAEYFAIQMRSVLASRPRKFTLFDTLRLRRALCPFRIFFSVG